MRQTTIEKRFSRDFTSYGEQFRIIQSSHKCESCNRVFEKEARMGYKQILLRMSIDDVIGDPPMCDCDRARCKIGGSYQRRYRLRLGR